MANENKPKIKNLEKQAGPQKNSQRREDSFIQDRFKKEPGRGMGGAATKIPELEPARMIQESGQKRNSKPAWNPKKTVENDLALASKLAQAKSRAQAATSASDSATEPPADFSGYGPLARRRDEATGQKNPASASSALAKLSKVTSGLLKWSWQNIIFFSFSSSIIYIDLHVLGNMIFPKMFCKLGHEWIPPEVQKSSPKQAEAFGNNIGTFEKGCCCMVNGCCGLITISVLAISAAVMGIINSTIGQVFGWISGVWTSLTGG
jgi:hypothetical protein